MGINVQARGSGHHLRLMRILLVHSYIFPLPVDPNVRVLSRQLLTSLENATDLAARIQPTRSPARRPPL